MGVLDDAIKQHLELKRKHGASEDELRKQEAEALGPGRREAPVRPTPRTRSPTEDLLAGEDVEVADRRGRSAGLRGRAAATPTCRSASRRSWTSRAGGARARAAARSRARARRRAAPGARARPRARRGPARRSRSRPPGGQPRSGGAREPGRGRGRARGDARVPPGDARARPALVRAEAAARLRLRRVAPPGLDTCPVRARSGQAAARAGPTSLLRRHGGFRRVRRHGTPLSCDQAGTAGAGGPRSQLPAAQLM